VKEKIATVQIDINNNAYLEEKRPDTDVLIDRIGKGQRVQLAYD
jgi:hypothetical protein